MRWVALACLIAALLAAWPQTGDAAGRWVMHMATRMPTSGVVGMPVDTFSLPETDGHWVWPIWFDLSSGAWAYDTQNPYYFSDGAVEFYTPAFNRWCYLLLYDTVTGLYY